MQFGTGYYAPMDRGHAAAHDHSHGHGFPAHTENSTGDVGVSIGDMGMSMGLGPIPNVQTIASRIRPGTKNVEFVFTGTGKGSGQGQTPGMYGLKQRRALVEMGKANRVDFTTHSTVGVYGLSGMDQQGNFSKASKNASLQEVKRAIEFAADVGGGGPVVVHTGEFSRPISDSKWNEEGKWKDKFKMYDDESEKAAWRVVDTRTGGVIQEARKNRKVSRPVWRVAKEGMEYIENGVKKIAKGSTDEGGQPIYIDYFNERLTPERRVPEFDEEKNRFKTQQMDWKDIKREAGEMTLRAKQLWRDYKAGRITEKEYEDSRWCRFKDATSEDQIEVKPEESFIISTLETNAANSRGWAFYYGGDFDKTVERIKKLKKAREIYKKIQDSVDPEEQWKLKREVQELRISPGIIPPDSKFPTDIIDDAIRSEERQMKQSQEASASQWAQSEESEETMRHVESAEVYARKEAFDAYAKLAFNAMRQTEKLRQQGNLKNNKPLSVAMENLFPEHYGSHPDELKDLVLGSREKFKQDLMKQHGYSESKAAKLAQDHLTATFDTGHLNMWRKYWQGDPNKTLEENDKMFDKWSLEKLRELAKAKIIGHVHIDDNYGYHDDHLAPGEGNTPIKEMMKVLKEEGYDGELIIEPGADYTTDVSGFHSVMKTWKHFGLNVYGGGSGKSATGRSWGSVQYGFFGQNQPPYFTFGAYSPSEDWTLWSGVPLE